MVQVKVKVKFTLEQAANAQRGVQFCSFFNLSARWGLVVNATPRPLYPPVKTRYPLYRRLGGPQGRFGWVLKISVPLGFKPWTVQLIASHYTD
jgi:hypothetical protein